MSANWQELAIQEAARQGCAADIVLATIDAETGGVNKTGDSGNALGYGQVWPKWHMASFYQMGAELGIEVPSDLESLTALVLNNDTYSMAVAVNVIKKMWEGCGGDWAQFTYSYVGPGIPASDFQRRQNIWIQYSNSNYDYTGQAQANSSEDQTTANSVQSSYYSQFEVSQGGEFHHDRNGVPHSGLDLMMSVGTPIVSISDGVVTGAGDMGATGWTVKVEDSNGNTFIYGHLSRIDVNVGDAVSPGAMLGLSGGERGAPGAGNSTGPHLHLGVKDPFGNYLDPNYFISGNGAGSSNGTFYNLRDDKVLPGTNMQVVPGSLAYGDTLYGRRYRVIVSSLDGSTALDVSQLRCKFSCTKNYLIEPNYSEIVIYNMSPKTEKTVIMEGYRVVVEAGYLGSQYGKIFDGSVVQVIREKENGTDYKVTLVALDSDQFLVNGTAAFSITRGRNAREIVEHIASAASVPSGLGSISPNLPDARLTRGKVVFGMACDYLRQIAQSVNGTFYMEDGAINIVKPQDYTDEEAVELSPATGLIGVPTQQDYGASIKMLLNPRVKINTFIHIDNSLIRNEKYESGQPIYPLDQDGLYRVIKLTHRGDTRGNDWYTEVETITQLGIQPALITDYYQDPT